jgi:hypothetical protein
VAARAARDGASGRVTCRFVLCVLLPGPLSAVVKAQAQASMTTVDFINAVGFEKENRSAISVDFKYLATDDNGTDVKTTLTVPFLAMMPIPSLEVRNSTCASAVQ